MGDVSPIATPLAEAEVQAQLEEIDVDAPRVGIVMGSKSDMETMEKAAQELEERGILHELRVMSAHREPDVVADYAKNARMRGPARDHRRRRHLRGAAGRGRRAHRPAGDRRAAVGTPDAPRAGSTRSSRSCRCRRACRWRASVSTTPRNAAILAAQILGA